MSPEDKQKKPDQAKTKKPETQPESDSKTETSDPEAETKKNQTPDKTKSEDKTENQSDKAEAKQSDKDSKSNKSEEQSTKPDESEADEQESEESIPEPKLTATEAINALDPDLNLQDPIDPEKVAEELSQAHQKAKNTLTISLDKKLTLKILGLLVVLSWLIGIGIWGWDSRSQIQEILPNQGEDNAETETNEATAEAELNTDEEQVLIRIRTNQADNQTVTDLQAALTDAGFEQVEVLEEAVLQEEATIVVQEGQQELAEEIQALTDIDLSLSPSELSADSDISLLIYLPF